MKKIAIKKKFVSNSSPIHIYKYCKAVMKICRQKKSEPTTIKDPYDLRLK